MDGKAFGAEIVEIVKGHLERTLGPLVARMDAMERRFGELPAPKDVDESRIAESVRMMISSELSTFRADIDAVKAYADGFPDLVSDLVAGTVAKGIADLPKPKDGDPGTSVTVDDVAPMIAAEVVKAVAAVPPAQPGQDADPEVIRQMVAEAVAALPPAPAGKDADPAEIVRMVSDAVAAIPKPRDGDPGKDADPAVIKAMVDDAVAALPPAQPGRDVDQAAVEAKIVSEVERAVAAIPRPQDGKSITVDDVRPLVDDLVAKVAAAIPVPKDGCGIKELLIDRDGALVATMDDGRLKSLGKVVGTDGVDADMVALERRAAEMIAALPRPRDGLDALGFDDLDLVETDKGMMLRFVRGDRIKEFRLPVVIDRGVYKEGGAYHKGDGCTWGGSFWIAQVDGPEGKPDSGKGWRLAVKKGRDGKDVVPKAPAKAGPVTA